MKNLQVLLLFLLLAPLGFAQDEVLTKDRTVEAIIKEADTNSKVMDHLQHVVNRIGPRLTSSDNLQKACEWARDQFQAMGLQARLEPWGQFPVGFNRGPWSGHVSSPEKHPLRFTTPSWSAGTDGPVTARTVLGPESEEDFDADAVRGAWVLHEKPLKIALRNKLYEKYRETGIAGVIWRNKRTILITSGNHRISWEKLPSLVRILMHPEDFDHITKTMEQQAEKEKMVQLTISVQNEFKKGPISLYNVIADLKGTELAHEYVVVGGHIDSWDGARGCIDNGTGLSTTLEAARLLTSAGAKPRRTIRFMLWSGEEQGLMGSSAFVRKNKEELKNYSAVLVHDGGTNVIRGIYGTEEMIPLFKKAFAPVIGMDEKFTFQISKVERISAGGSSDHSSFVAGGVPGFFWTQQGRAVYSYAHHTQNDTLDQAVPEYQKHSSKVIALGAWGIANLDEKLPRKNVGGRQENRRRLGVNMDGLEVTGVSEDSVADAAGILEGDLILKLGGKDLKTLDELRNTIQASELKTTVVVQRDGKELELKVEFHK